MRNNKKSNVWNPWIQFFWSLFRTKRVRSSEVKRATKEKATSEIEIRDARRLVFWSYTTINWKFELRFESDIIIKKLK